MNILSEVKQDLFRDLADYCLQFPRVSLKKLVDDFDELTKTYSENNLRRHLVRYGRIYQYQGEWLTFTDFDSKSRVKLQEFATNEDYHLTDNDLEQV